METAPDASPRFGRGARWAIGLLVTGVFGLAGVVFLIVGLAGLRLSDSFRDDPVDPDARTERINATVIDVDLYESGLGAPDSGIGVDVDFWFDGDHAVTWLEWPTGRPQPEEGDRVRVEFDPQDPEYSVRVAETSTGGDDDSSATEVRFTSGAAQEPAPESEWIFEIERNGWAWWAAALSFVLAGIAFVVTLVWALRAPAKPRPVPPPLSAGPYGPPPGGPYGYPPPPPS